MFIPGAPSFAEPIQGSIAHIIMMNFTRRMESHVGAGEAMILLNLRIEIQLFHDQMKYPWSQIRTLEQNSQSDDQLSRYFAIKSLANVVKLINRENFVKIMFKTDTDFCQTWKQAMKEVEKFYGNLKNLEILSLNSISASTFALYNENNGDKNDLMKSLKETIKKVKGAWQSIWVKFNQTRSAFDYVLSEKNGNFDIKLSRTKPFVQDEILIILSCNTNNQIRLWARPKINLFKTRVTYRPNKWVITEDISTKSSPTWWLYAIKKIDLDQDENNYANICREETFTTDY